MSSLNHEFDIALNSPSNTVKDEFRYLIWLRRFSKFS